MPGELAGAQVRRHLGRIARGPPRGVRHRARGSGGVACARGGLGARGCHLRDRASARCGAGARSLLARRLSRLAGASSPAAGGGGAWSRGGSGRRGARSRARAPARSVVGGGAPGRGVAADPRLGAGGRGAALGADLRGGARGGREPNRAPRRHRGAGGRGSLRRRLSRHRREPAAARGATGEGRECGAGRHRVLRRGRGGRHPALRPRRVGHLGDGTRSRAGCREGRDMDRCRRCRDRRPTARADRPARCRGSPTTKSSAWPATGRRCCTGRRWRRREPPASRSWCATPSAPSRPARGSARNPPAPSPPLPPLLC